MFIHYMLFSLSFTNVFNERVHLFGFQWIHRTLFFPKNYAASNVLTKMNEFTNQSIFILITADLVCVNS